MATKTGHFGFVKAAARTDVGRKRKNNEDAFGVFHEAGVFCVADGMGGGDDGEIASAAVVKGLEDGLKSLTFASDGAYAVADVANVVEAALTKASAWIFNRTRAKKLSGCGSTFVGFALDGTEPGQALAIHAGDSRLYLLHGRSIRQITHDHSVAEMIGEKDESKVNPMFRSMVMNAIGIRAKADPERTPFKVAPGDRLLVCSDGLSRMVPDKKILAISRKNEEVSAAADALIAAALEAGGIDNVTVVLAEIGELPKALPALAAPPVESADEAVTDGGERETGSTGEGGSTDSSQTMSTIAPAISGEMLAPEEAEEGDASELESTTWQHVAKRRKRKVTVLIVSAVVLAVLVLMIAVGIVLRLRHPSSPAVEVVSLAETEPGGGLIEAALPTNALPTNALPTNALPTNALPTNALPPNALPTNAAPTSVTAANVTAADVTATNAVQPIGDFSSAPIVVATNVPSGRAASTRPPPVVETAATNVPAKPPVPEAFEDVVKACAEESLALFCQAFRRLEGPANRELAAQMKRFEAGAHACARMRSRETAERVVVDLRYCLISAEKSRKALAASDRAEVRQLLVWWEALRAVESVDVRAMQIAARFIEKLPEAAAR